MFFVESNRFQNGGRCHYVGILIDRGTKPPNGFIDMTMPFRCVVRYQMIRHTKTLGIIQVDEPVWKHLTKAELAENRSDM